MRQQLNSEYIVMNFILDIVPTNEYLWAVMGVSVYVGNFAMNIKEDFSSTFLLMGSRSILIIYETKYFALIRAHDETMLGFTTVG